MSIKVAIHHQTTYRFDREITLLPHILRLKPAPHCLMPISSYSLKVIPQNHVLHWQQDAFANYLARLFFPEKSDELVINVDLHVDMSVINPFDFFLEEYAEKFPFSYDEQLQQDLAPYMKITERGPLLMDFVSNIDLKQQGSIEFLVALNKSVLDRVAYQIRHEPGVQSCEETLQTAIGSCRDSALLLMQIIRHLGLASRFVSGYLVQLRADEEALARGEGPTEDFSSLHAWSEVYIPGAGWIGLDPTSGLFAGEGHIPLACTPDPQSAAPVSGTTEPCQVVFSHENSVQRL